MQSRQGDLRATTLATEKPMERTTGIQSEGPETHTSQQERDGRLNGRKPASTPSRASGRSSTPVIPERRGGGGGAVVREAARGEVGVAETSSLTVNTTPIPSPLPVHHGVSLPPPALRFPRPPPPSMRPTFVSRRLTVSLRVPWAAESLATVSLRVLADLSTSSTSALRTHF